MPVDVVTIPNVELVRVGVHEISTGTWEVGRTDLTDAVAAARARVVRDPVIKLGHEGRMGDGAPALGRVRNLRVVGNTLVGDFVDVPRAVAAMIRNAWPSRSVEGFTGYQASDGTTYGFVMTAVALLGSVMSGVHDLADISDVAELYGVAAGSSARPVVIASAPGIAAADRARAIAVARARRLRSTRTVVTTTL